MKKVRLVKAELHGPFNYPLWVNADTTLPEGYEELEIVPPAPPCTHVVGAAVGATGRAFFCSPCGITPDISFKHCPECGVKLG